jgi:hypothetical protein
MPTRGLRRTILACLLSAGALAGCATWKPAVRGEPWTLYAKRELADGEGEEYRRAIEPAWEAVSELLGPFEKRVALYVWEGGAADATSSAQLDEQVGGVIQEVPGIGPARVRAFHARTSGLFGARSGIYLGAAETGTIAHELVHARIAEESLALPLWLEEGLANIAGDGYFDGERWVVDGLSCWPVRELTEARISDQELAALLALSSDDTSDVRANVLAHFVGWAIVFDLYRERGEFAWREWVERYRRGIPPGEARERMQRSLTPQTLEQWLERLADERPEVRIATAKGLWKLRSLIAVEALLDRLEKEEEPLVRIALAINVLASAGEMRLPEDLQRRMWRHAWPVLRRAKLADPTEQRAIDQLAQSFRWSSRQSPREPLEKLKRYWAE